MKRELAALIAHLESLHTAYYAKNITPSVWEAKDIWSGVMTRYDAYKQAADKATANPISTPTPTTESDAKDPSDSGRG